MKLVFMDETRLDETDHIISVGHVAEILHQKGSFLHVSNFSSTSPSTWALSNNHVSEYMHTILLPVVIFSHNHDYISKLGI